MKPKIFIDSGHGGDDNGAAWGEKNDYIEEDDLNLAIAFYLRYELLLRGADVMMSRHTDESVTLTKRVRMANEWGAGVFISIHADAFHRETVSGISTHVYTHAGDKTAGLGLAVQTQLMREFPDRVNRGLKRSNFHVLRNTRMPAILVEAEFISNPDSRRFLKEPDHQVRIAQAIARGINDRLIDY